ncbi:MAG: hypothetical protein HC896_11315 [Bacteroidales bacterium]|nr:hypothetical protein [Bacteroidales bacterium]
MMFLFCFSVPAVLAQKAAQGNISLNPGSHSLISLLKTIEGQTDYQFSYSKKKIPANQKIPITKDTVELQQLMSLLETECHISFTWIDNRQVVVKSIDAPNTSRHKDICTVSGLLTDKATGEPLIGGSVVNISTNKGVDLQYLWFLFAQPAKRPTKFVVLVPGL